MNPPPHLGEFGNLDAAILMRHLPGVKFPADKEHVASVAEQHGAPRRRSRGSGRRVANASTTPRWCCRRCRVTRRRLTDV